MSPRRLTGAEETELLKAARRLKASQDETDRRRSERDRLILELVDSNVRMVDVADVVKLTRKAIRDAIDRAREQ